VTIVLASFLLWALPDTPHNARFLSKTQKTQAINRIRTNHQGFKDTHFKWYQAREALLDVKVWLPAMIACALSITNGALNAVSQPASLESNSGPVA
jgi:ACS family allantoate permease-like MFS transporter